MLAALLPLVLLSAGAQPFTIHWDPELSEEIHRGGYDTAVSSALAQAGGFVEDSLGIELAKAIEVTVYAPRNYERAFGPQAAQRWWAHYQARKIHINGGIAITGSFTGLLVHELTHAALDINRFGGRFPIWMNEGLARTFELEAMGRGAVDDVQRLFLKDALRNREIKPLTAMKGPLDANSYLESFAAVTQLMQRQGRANVLAFYQAIAMGSATPDQAWTKLGIDEAAFAKKFEAWVAEYRG